MRDLEWIYGHMTCPSPILLLLLYSPLFTYSCYVGSVASRYGSSYYYSNSESRKGTDNGAY